MSLFDFIALLIFLVAAVGMPLMWWLMRRAVAETQMIERAVGFALNRFNQLYCPELEVITETRLRRALRSASAEDKILLECLLRNMSDLGHSIDSEVYVTRGMSRMGMPYSYTHVTHTWGLSLADLQRHMRRWKNLERR